MKVEDGIDQIIDGYYPWGEPGFLDGPPPPTATERRSLIGRWLQSESIRWKATALALIARFRAILAEIEERAHRRHMVRLVARIDASALVKSPASILEKMAREWRAEGGCEGGNPPISFSNYTAELSDLARFRVVANFLSDVETIAQALQEPYGPATDLTVGQRAMREDFLLERNRLEDSIHLPPKERKKGERCRKGVFYPVAADAARPGVEVQVQTLLQEAWDKKDHFLIYEPQRRGETIADRHAIEMFAMSELLYVADLTFDRLRADILGPDNSRK